MTERELKAEVLRIAYAGGWRVYHVPATTVRGSQGRGYPDLTLSRAGVVYWFELKQEDGRVTDEQDAWKMALPLGHHYIIRPHMLPFVEGLLA